MTPQADKVRDERLQRGWSVRKASGLGGISNTWWQNFENGTQPLTESINAAVAKAFGWPDDWAQVSSPPDRLDDILELLQEVSVQVQELIRRSTAPTSGRSRAAGGSR
jgi:transcriptional regulator with XRE-family HTH domain